MRPSCSFQVARCVADCLKVSGGDLRFEILAGMFDAEKRCAYSRLDNIALGSFELCVGAGCEVWLLLRRPVGAGAAECFAELDDEVDLDVGQLIRPRLVSMRSGL
jgi:hypothetical protein